MHLRAGAHIKITNSQMHTRGHKCQAQSLQDLANFGENSLVYANANIQCALHSIVVCARSVRRGLLELTKS